MIMADLRVGAEMLYIAKELFRFPDQENLAALQESLARLSDWAGLMDGAGAGTGLDAAAAGDVDLDQLQIDFTGLFINGFPTAKAHPFAGWYQGEGIVMGNSDERMRKFYARWGVECDHRQLSADHIMVELEFMALMAEKHEDTGDDIYHRAMGEMMSEHMQHWIFDFLTNIQENARTGFYRGLGAGLWILFDTLTIELKEVA